MQHNGGTLLYLDGISVNILVGILHWHPQDDPIRVKDAWDLYFFLQLYVNLQLSKRKNSLKHTKQTSSLPLKTLPLENFLATQEYSLLLLFRDIKASKNLQIDIKSLKSLLILRTYQDFSGGPVVNKSPANAGTWIWSLIWENYACLGATEPKCCSY